MLKSITFENYKCFRHKGKVELKPLTILVGPNNAGKSSLTDLLLLLKQSISGNYQPNSLLVTDGKHKVDGPLSRMINHNSTHIYVKSGNVLPLDIGIELDINLMNQRYRSYKVGIAAREQSHDEMYRHKFTQEYVSGMPDEVISHFDRKDLELPNESIKSLLSKIFDIFYLNNNISKIHFLIARTGKLKQNITQTIKFKKGPLNGFSATILPYEGDSVVRDHLGAGMENIIHVTLSPKHLKKIFGLINEMTSSILSGLSPFDKKVSSFKARIKNIKIDLKNRFNWAGFSRMGDGILNYRKGLWMEQEFWMKTLDVESYTKGKKKAPYIEIPEWLKGTVISNRKEENDKPQLYQEFYFRPDTVFGRKARLLRYSKNTSYLVERYLLELATYKSILNEIKKRIIQGSFTQNDEGIIFSAIHNLLCVQYVTSFQVYGKIFDDILRSYSYSTDQSFNRVNLIDIRKSTPSSSYSRKELMDFLGSRPALLFTDKINLSNVREVPLPRFGRTKGKVNQKNLEEAVNRDLNSIGIPYRLSVKKFGPTQAGDIDKRFYLMLNGPSGRALGIHEVGYGLTQLIPLLIRKNYFSMIYKNSYNSTTIIREPEANIHPSLQSKIASIIVASISNSSNVSENLKPSQNVIVETHSEHFIRGVQIAVAKGDIKNSDVNILYVNQSPHGNSTVKKLELEEKGKFKSDFPKGFFESGFKETIELMKLQK